ncbi:AT hook containing transcription factor 1 homolog isoform X2 [Halictus rubicundus]|uniref:AT hook containing transcription factor 1 homolog isoform X2 n=1 Tax=Halictus rubicundus TaxID=77578 RepID=UPI004035F425
MKELEEVNCEIHNVIDIQHAFSSRSNNSDGNEGGSSNSSQPYSGIDSHCGGFLSDTRYAWLNYGSHIIIFNARTGESISSWTFRGKIACVCQFPAQPGELPLLLIGLDNGATRIKDSIGLVCIFDCASSRVLRAVKMPVGVEQVCVVSGGAKWEEFNEKRPDNFLMQMDGIACIVLRNLHHLMIDLQRSAWETPDDLSLIMDETNPADIEFITSKDSLHRNQLNKSKHMVCNLMNQRIEKHIGFNREEFESTGFLDERLTNTIVSSTKIGCLISGCLGRVIIWQNDGSVGSISLPVDETMIVTHLALLEPADDPRPFYYLWVVFQDESSKVPPLLRMYALLFQRKYSERGTNLYFNLEAEPSLKFEFELDADDRVINLSAIERETNPDQTESESKRGEDSLLLISSTGRTLLFDLNQWYKEQMPRTVGECKNPNSILASYDIEARPTNVASNEIVSCTYVPRTLQEFPNNRLSTSEERFYPNSLALEWIELSVSKLTFWLSRGVQAELLHEMAIAGPILLTEPSEMFHKCLSVGLVPFNTEVSFSSDHNAQRDMLLSLCLEQHWATFLIRCAKEWSDGSAAYMYPSFLNWGIQRAASIKMIADHLCVPLFDQSGNNIGESELKTLRFCYQQLECLSNVVSKLPLETNNLVKQRRALKRVSIFFQVLLWFYDAGLLPESQDMEAPVSAAVKIPYPYEKLHRLYKEKRESAANDKQPGEIKEVFFIDEMVARECPALSTQWKMESGDMSANGYYPPPSLQSLLRSYLTDCDQGEADKLECKHQITIYLLMDLDLLLPDSYAGVDRLIEFPSSFKMSSSVIKLTQAFWLLDHEDYRGFLGMMTGQLISDTDVKDWHHKLVLRTLIRNDQHKLALMYLRIRKPPLSSVQDQSTLIGLSVEHGLVQSAFHHRPQTHYAQLLMCFFQSCKAYDKLTDVLHLALDTEEEEMFDKFLEESKSEDVRLLYYLQRCRYMEANSGSFAAVRFNPGTKNDHMDMLNAYNATLPNIMKKFSMSMSKSASETGMEPRYPRPMTYNKNCQRATSIYETVIRKAKETFHREEKALIPFITAPCTTLKPNDEQIDINCVMSPKVMETHRKRTLDEVQADDDSDKRTPERIKRRKLVDDGDAALSAAFSTPLVKRKVSHRDTRIETPHSILKIRQLIRNSTSASLGSVQPEDTDSNSAAIDKEKKINRQIRFNISQSKKNASNDEISAGDSSAGMHASERSGETFFSSLEADKSLMESAVLSEGSITCKNICAARPRPSIGRSHLQTPSFQESNRRSLGNSHTEASNLLGDLAATPTKRMLQTPRRCTSWFSASLHSPAVLSPDSSFDIGSPLRRSSVLPSQLAPTCNSTNISTASKQERSCRNSEEAMNIDEQEEEEEEEEEELEEEEGAILDASSSMQITSPTIPKSNCFKFNDGNVSNHQKNGGISKDQEDEAMNVSYAEDKEDADNDDEFESFSNTFGNSSARSENSERRSWSPKLRDEVDNDAQEQRIDDLKNGDHHFDITDDESNYAEDMVLALEETTEVIETVSRTTQVRTGNEYDASNITDDESDASVPAEPRKNVEDHLDNNNSMSETADKAPPKTQRAESKDTDDEASQLNDSVASRMTRSRRASSITKEIRPSAVGSPSKVVPKTPARSRRASSLMKEVLIASIAAADEGIKRTGSSGSEDSSVTSSPSKSRGRRASMVAKDVSVVEEQGEEDAGVSTPKKTRGKRASSMAKDVSLAENHGEEDAGLSTPKRTRGRRASSIAKDVSPVGKQAEEEVSPRKTRGRRTSLVAKSTPLGEEEREEESPGSASSKKTRGRRASSVAKDVHPVGEVGEEESSAMATPKKTRGKRASSVAKDVHPVGEEGEEDYLAASPSRRTRGRKTSTKDVLPVEEQEEVRTPARRNTRRAASVQKEVPESTRFSRTSSSSSIAVENEEEKLETRGSKTRGTAAGNRSLRAVAESMTSEEAAEEKRTVKLPGRRRGSSVPKETVDTVRTRRASSVAKEVIPEEDFEPPLDVSRGRHMVATISSSAGNTRNRRSSIQSIPEELEEILSVPLKERMSGASNKKQSTSVPRQRRAASVEIPQTDTMKRTRSTRSKAILKETIVEEEVQEDPEPSNVKKATRRKDTLVDSGAREIPEVVSKPRKGGRRASVNRDASEQFSFSQPDKTNDPPSDQKAIQEVPNFVFSPPHTRSKTVTPDNRD